LGDAQKKTNREERKYHSPKPIRREITTQKVRLIIILYKGAPLRLKKGRVSESESERGREPGGKTVMVEEVI